jgi:hypothetical protein
LQVDIERWESEGGSCTPSPKSAIVTESQVSGLSTSI